MVETVERTVKRHFSRIVAATCVEGLSISTVWHATQSVKKCYFLFSPKIWYYIIMFECEESAYKHWITRPQIDYVITHPVKILEVESKRKDDRVMAFLGYVDEFREKKIEVLVSQRSRKAFHAMECRTEWLRYFDE